MIVFETAVLAGCLRGCAGRKLQWVRGPGRTAGGQGSRLHHQACGRHAYGPAHGVTRPFSQL